MTKLTNFIQDIDAMHTKFGVHDAVAKMDAEKLRKFLEFRINFLVEELTETQKAFAENDPEEIVDGLVDLTVIAVGTLGLLQVDMQKAWDAVHTANMSKVPGVKPGRINPLGLPDLIKPSGWCPPSHSGNHGLLTVMVEQFGE